MSCNTSGPITFGGTFNGLVPVVSKYQAGIPGTSGKVLVWSELTRAKNRKSPRATDWAANLDEGSRPNQRSGKTKYTTSAMATMMMPFFMRPQLTSQITDPA